MQAHHPVLDLAWWLLGCPPCTLEAGAFDLGTCRSNGMNLRVQGVCVGKQRMGSKINKSENIKHWTWDSNPGPSPFRAFPLPTEPSCYSL